MVIKTALGETVINFKGLINEPGKEALESFGS